MIICLFVCLSYKQSNLSCIMTTEITLRDRAISHILCDEGNVGLLWVFHITYWNWILSNVNAKAQRDQSIAHLRHIRSIKRLSHSAYTNGLSVSWMQWSKHIDLDVHLKPIKPYNAQTKSILFSMHGCDWFNHSTARTHAHRVCYTTDPAPHTKSPQAIKSNIVLCRRQTLLACTTNAFRTAYHSTYVGK